jgi:hypothetical protein
MIISEYAKLIEDNIENPLFLKLIDSERKYQIKKGTKDEKDLFIETVSEIDVNSLESMVQAPYLFPAYQQRRQKELLKWQSPMGQNDECFSYKRNLEFIAALFCTYCLAHIDIEKRGKFLDLYVKNKGGEIRENLKSYVVEVERTSEGWKKGKVFVLSSEELQQIRDNKNYDFREPFKKGFSRILELSPALVDFTDEFVGAMKRKEKLTRALYEPNDFLEKEKLISGESEDCEKIQKYFSELYHLWGNARQTIFTQIFNEQDSKTFLSWKTGRGWPYGKM